MTPINEPTLGEVLRRLDEVSRQLIDIVREIKEDRVDAAKTYVRQDVYIAERQASNAVVADLHGDIQSVKGELGREIRGIKDDRKSDLGWRRQMWLAIGGLAVTTLIGIIGLIINFTGSR